MQTTHAAPPRAGRADRRTRLSAALIGTPATIPLARAQLALLADGPMVAACIVIPGAEPPDAALPKLDLADVAIVDSPDGLGGLKGGIDLAVVSLPGAMTEAIRSIRASLRRQGITERFLPPLGEMLAAQPPYPVGLSGVQSGTPSWAAPRIDVAEIVGRAPHPIDRDSVARILTGKRVLITGAGGSIGTELTRIAAGFDPAQLILMERAENALFEIDRQLGERFPRVARKAVLHDVVDQEQTLRLLVGLRPDVVFHSAAHKHVPLMEDHPSHAVSNNLFGTKSIADAALAVGAERFVFVSTDKAVNPTSVMGATKRLAEQYIQGLHARAHAHAPGPGEQAPTRFSMVRFGNVLGSAASVLQIWSAQLAEGGPITVTDPRMTRYFMTIPEAAALVIQAAAIESPGAAAKSAPVYVLDMGQPARIVDLAERFIRAHGFEPRRADGSGGRVYPTGMPVIDIAFTGIRPGEKLFEELSYSAELLRPTPCPGINAWRGNAPSAGAATAMIADLSAIRAASEKELVIAAIRRHLPEMAAAAA
jgi:FlaA1/EpsC-like NDP-sugar epimerase